MWFLQWLRHDVAQGNVEILAVMLAAAMWAVLAPRPSASAPAAKASGSGTHRRKSDKGFMSRVEERFDKRREQGDL